MTPAALAVDCTVCNAKPGDRCVTPSGVTAFAAHQVRVRAVLASAKERGWKCGICPTIVYGGKARVAHALMHLDRGELKPKAKPEVKLEHQGELAADRIISLGVRQRVGLLRRFRNFIRGLLARRELQA